MHVSPIGTTKGAVYCHDFITTVSAQPNVSCVFLGHDHEIDNVQKFREKHYAWGGHFGSNYGVDYYGYRIVNVLKNGEICTYQYNFQENKPVNSNRFM